ncbi:MAG: GNAT family N-acetyltransferase [Chloroflexi bacterium]|nr:GNAT family N-acetyltransferase [Chloroflexota bacterium]
MAVEIVEERPDSADAMTLIAELDAILMPIYAPESRHGFSVDKLLAQGVLFFVIRVDGVPAACGGLKLDDDYGEVKRMYVRPQFRGSGLGRLMLDRLAAATQAHGMSLLRLETGIYQKEAISLYERYGFQRIPPFGDYFDDPVSLCYEKRLVDV